MSWSLGRFRGEDHASVEIANGEGYVICTVPREYARLIAAAPALLEACKAKLLALKGKEYDPEAFDVAAKKCSEAIAIAENTTETCETCRAMLIRTSNLYLCCPNGHGKLVPNADGRKPAALPDCKQAWKRWCKWFDQHERNLFDFALPVA